jgi:hypothetical protein
MTMQKTKTVTYDLEKLAKTAALTGVAGGLFQYLATPLFPEQEFLYPALHIGGATFVALYLIPDGSVLLRSAAVGAMMGAQIMFMTVQSDLGGAIRYGLLAATSAYVGTEYIIPKLVGLETEVKRSYF